MPRWHSPWWKKVQQRSPQWKIIPAKIPSQKFSIPGHFQMLSFWCFYIVHWWKMIKIGPRWKIWSHLAGTSKGTVFPLKIFKVVFSCDSYEFILSLWRQHRLIQLWIVSKNSLLNLTSKKSFCAPFLRRNEIGSPLIFSNKKKYKPPRFFCPKKLLPLFLTTKKKL